MPAPAKVPSDGAQTMPLGEQAVHQRMVASGALGEPPHRRCLLSGRRRSRLLGLLGCGRAQAVAVAGNAALGRLGQVLPQVEPVGDLHGVGGAQAGAFGVGSRAVSANDLHAGVAGQPLGQRRGLAAGEQFDRCAGLAVGQHRAVDLATLDRKVVHAQHPRRGRHRVGQRHEQSQQAGAADGGLERAGQPGAGAAGQGDRDGRQHRGQPRGAPLVAGGEPGDLLGEGLPGAGGVVAEQPLCRQRDHQAASAHGDVGQATLVAAVHPGGGDLAVRAGDRAGAGVGEDAHALGGGVDVVDLDLGEVRQNGVKSPIGTRPTFLPNSAVAAQAGAADCEELVIPCMGAWGRVRHEIWARSEKGHRPAGVCRELCR
jgi:hypothetical protein